MRKFCLCLAVLMLLSGCTAKSPSEPEENQESQQTQPETTASAETEASAQPDTQTVPTETATQAETEPLRTTRELYREALENLLENGMFPDGSEAETDEPMEENQFAVFDIDSDGREELVIEYTAASMAGMRELVFDTDGQNGLVREFLEFPETVWYDNGIVVAYDSHNQGYSGDFWPYTLYQYDAERDGYYEIANVYAMDKALLEELDLLDEYPEDADTSQSGFVYFIGNDNPVDVTEYELWRNSWEDGAEEITIPFVPLTPENIAAVTGQ